MSQLILNLDNKELETSLHNFAKKHKKALDQVVIDAIKQFIGLDEDKEIRYVKKDITKHRHIIQKEFDDNMCDESALEHITDSARYIHNLRRQSKS